MRISTHFGEAQRWAQTHFGVVALGDVRSPRRVCTLATGWARQPEASSAQLSQGQVYDSKAAYQLLGQGQATSNLLQYPYIHYVDQ